jgi:hypothetical protein
MTREQAQHWIAQAGLASVSTAVGLKPDPIARWLAGLPVRTATRLVLEQAQPRGAKNHGCAIEL